VSGTAISRVATLLRTLRGDSAGLALIELAFGLPVLLALGFSGMETANMAVTRMRLSQLSMMAADNMARVGQDDGTSEKRLFESDINDVFEAVRIQGAPIDFVNRGRVIVSSLQQNASGGQWIAWQRCYGVKAEYTSSYGAAGNGRTVTTLAGMGPAGAEIKAPSGAIVMFVEVAYDYRAIVAPFAQGLSFFGLLVNNQVIRYKSSFIVRNARKRGDSTIAAATSTMDYGLEQNSPAVTRRTC